MRRREFLSALALTAATGLPRSARARSAGGLIELVSRPANYEAPLDAFVHRITPLDSFYVRSHLDTPVIDPGAFRLGIGGLVERPRELTLAQLEAFPQHEVEAVLQCAGNGRALFRPRMPGAQWKRGAMGNAVWSGPRLADVLKTVRPLKAAAHLELDGADRPVLPSTPDFVRGIPLAKGLHPDTLIAVRMNGRPLPKLHGGPARLVVPGWVADDWTKWIERIVVRPDEPKGFFYETAYRFPETPGAPGAPVPPEQTRPMTVMNVKSVIATPAAGAVLGLSGADVQGVAFSGGEGISRVDVSADGGATWSPAELERGPSPYGFVRFLFRFRPTAPGPYRLAARAEGGKGAVQPGEPVWNPSGYLHNAVHVVPVEVRA